MKAKRRNRIKTLTEPYDLIFVDLEFSAYLSITMQLLDAGLLSLKGRIFVDNGMIQHHMNSIDESCS